MSLSKYVPGCQQIAAALMQSLTEADRSALSEDLRALGMRGWVQFCSDAEIEVKEFLTATPKERTRRKAWQDQSRRRRLTLAAAHLARQSAAVSSALAAPGMPELSADADFRHMAAMAWEWQHLVAESMDELGPWPFPELPFPFCKD